MDDDEIRESDVLLAVMDQISDEYKNTLHKSNEFNNLLMKKIEELSKEVSESKKLLNEMENNILKYCMYHPSGFINRKYLDFFMQSVRDTDATDEEWQLFLETFSYNTDPMCVAVYGWIDGYTKNDTTPK